MPRITQDDSEQYYLVSDVARIMSVTEKTVRDWITIGAKGKKLAASKVGKSWHITRVALSDFANRTVNQ